MVWFVGPSKARSLYLMKNQEEGFLTSRTPFGMTEWFLLGRLPLTTIGGNRSWTCITHNAFVIPASAAF